MSFSSFVLILFIGIIGSFLSGMLGIGGSIVKYPMLLYIPPLFGFVAYTAHQVSGISAVQVLFTAGSALLVYRKGNYLHAGLIAYMGIPIIIGSFAGAYLAFAMPEAYLNIVFAFMATIATILMFLPNKQVDHEVSGPLHLNRILAVLSALLIGFLSGIVGAAGSFLLLPIMLVMLRIPTRVAIASSLAITLISSIGGVIGKVAAGEVLLAPSLIMIWSSLVGAPLGALCSKYINTKWLRLLLAFLILLSCLKIWHDVLH